MKRQKVLFVAGLALLSLAITALLFARNKSASLSVPAGENGAAQVIASNDSSAAVSSTSPTASVELSERGTKTFRVESDRTITESLRQALAAMGARVIAPVSARAVLVEATPAAAKRIAKDARFTVEDVLPAAKIQKALSEQCAGGLVKSVKVSIMALTVADRDRLVAVVAGEGGKLLHSPLGPESLVAEIPTVFVSSLAARGDVRWVELAPEHRLLNDKTVIEASANVDRLRTQHQLFGRGQKVTVCDTGLDKGLVDDVHLDFSGRVKEIVHIGKVDASDSGYKWTLTDYNGHGTHVAGTVLGDGTRSDGQYKGMAPAAELYFQAASDTEGKGVWIDNYQDLLSKSVANGSYIHSDSWGSTKGRITYGSVDNAFDTYLWNHPELLVVVAAGNAGDEDSGDRTISSYPATAKNVLTVGNTMSTRPSYGSWLLADSPENLNPTSSRGPTADGRIKPEIAAPGTAVYSTLSSKSLTCDPIYGNDYYTEMTGTSMATPLVSGTAALIREWLADRRGMTELPTAALMKAIIAGGGVTMTGLGAHKVYGAWTDFNLPQELPNTDYGWGRVNLEETLYPTGGRAVSFVDRIPFADQSEWTLDVTTTNASPLDVQLCWIDYPAAGSTDDGHTLINDLDLIVSNKTTGAVWCGNGIAGGDHTNTMESVRIAADDAPAGDYAVIVRGHAVPYASTLGGAAAVYVRGAFEDETLPDPLYVRNVRTDERYVYLDEALAEVQSGDTLEVERPVKLAKSVKLAVSCTIVATNADSFASPVTRVNGAMISLAAGTDLTLSNLVFVSGDESTAVTAAAGSRMILSGTVGVGKVAVADAEAILFAAPITLAGEKLSVIAPNGFAIGAQFGHWKGDYLSSSNAASRVVNVLNEELSGIAEKMSGRLIWGVVPCDPEDAKCVIEAGGTEVTYCRTLSQALQIALQSDSIITLKQPVVMPYTMTLSHDLALIGDGGSLAFTTNAPAAGFVIPEGTALSVSNLTVSAENVELTDCAFKVTGGALTLENGATLKNLSNSYQYTGKPWGGAIAVLAGSVTMDSGSKIENCAAHDGAVGGGAIYLGGRDATANLFGGTISGCSATQGGAVYAWGNSTTGASVVIKGDFTAKANRKSGSSQLSNLFLCHNALLSVPDYLLPTDTVNTIGLTFGRLGGKTDKNLEGQDFSVRHDGGLPADEGKSGDDTAKHFFSDVYPKLRGSYVSDDGQYWFRWGLASTTAPTSEFLGARIWIQRDSDTRYYYRNLNDALADLSWDEASYTMNVMDDTWITNHVEISKAVVIRRDPSLSVYSFMPGIFRLANSMYRIVPGGSLTLTDIEVYGAEKYDWGMFYVNAVDGLFSVNGGSLTLGAGSFVGYVCGETSRAANAITVYGGGTFTMEPGSEVGISLNCYIGTGDATGVGGGVLLDRSTAYLKGGEIYACAASRAGGLYVANKSTAYVSGDFTVRENFTVTEEGGVDYDATNNVVVSDNSRLVLADEFTGSLGLNEGIACVTDRFATVEWDYPSVDALTNSAAKFFHDFRGVAGTAVTNGLGEAVLVWSDWLSKAGGYVDTTGDEYRICLAPGQSVVVPQEFSVSPQSSGGRTVLSLEGVVDGCWYTVYATDALDRPFEPVVSVQLRSGETYEFEINPGEGTKFYKVLAEEGLR